MYNIIILTGGMMST